MTKVPLPSKDLIRRRLASSLFTKRSAGKISTSSVGFDQTQPVMKRTKE